MYQQQNTQINDDVIIKIMSNEDIAYETKLYLIDIFKNACLKSKQDYENVHSITNYAKLQPIRIRK